MLGFWRQAVHPSVQRLWDFSWWIQTVVKWEGNIPDCNQILSQVEWRLMLQDPRHRGCAGVCSRSIVTSLSARLWVDLGRHICLFLVQSIHFKNIILVQKVPGGFWLSTYIITIVNHLTQLFSTFVEQTPPWPYPDPLALTAMNHLSRFWWKKYKYILMNFHQNLTSDWSHLRLANSTVHHCNKPN